ncbi:MAG: ABC transporter permease subunit [Anaerolineae bacterium]|nr:ABC transporter permease subunit [Anaerolineae bacterium]
MRRYVIRRAIQSVFLLWTISLISFALMHLAPGGPVQFFEDPRMNPADIAALEHSLGLDQPLPVQYARWLWGILRLDFGRSYVSHRPVLDLIAERLPATMQLSLAWLILGLLGGISLGILAALKRGSWFDSAVRVFTVAGNALPHWWLGLMLIVFFSWVYSLTGFRVVPSGGMYTLGKQNDLLDRLWHMALPALIGALGGWITFSRFVRYQVLEVIGQDYVRTARAKGLPNQMVLTRHVLRNALIPLVTLLGGALAGLMSGAVLLESVFSWPGMGRLAIEAFFKRDYPLLMALIMIPSFLVILGNLLADIAYGLVDPRVRYD